MTDIVERLRRMATIQFAQYDYDAIKEAADEIERLQTRVAELEQENARLIEDRARFPDRPGDIGRMIDAHIGNLKSAKSSSDKYAAKYRDERDAAQRRIAELEAQRVPDGYVTVRADTLSKAITILAEEMESLKCSHTVSGRWACRHGRDRHEYVAEVFAALAAAPQPDSDAGPSARAQLDQEPVGGDVLEWSHTLLDGESATYEEAEAAIAELGDGWRLPTRAELESLIDLTRYDPAIDTDRFPDTKSTRYWTSTPCAWDAAARWVVVFGLGNVDGNRRGYLACVRAVRDVQTVQEGE